MAPPRAPDFAAAGLLAELDEAAAPDDFAEERGFAAVLRFAVEARLVVPDLRVVLLLRAAPPVLRLELLEPVDAEDEPPSIGHLPDITFCAASATASAISEPSFVALDMTDFAALSAVSAASIPASLIALRAFGLAAIAAAAAVSPAASISLLIAVFAILSTVVFPERFELEEDFDEVFRELDFAIAILRFSVAV